MRARGETSLQVVAAAPGTVPIERWPFRARTDRAYRQAAAAWQRRMHGRAFELCPTAFPNCSACPFAGPTGRPNPVVGIGPSDPQWIIFGEGPGATEIDTGEPFRGPSGALLNRAIEENGDDRAAIWIDNVTACRPPKGATESAMRKAQECCSSRVDGILEQFPGRPVLAVGKQAAQAVLLDPTLKISEIAGAMFEIETPAGKHDVIPTYHPAHLLRGGNGDAGGARAVDLLWWNVLYDVRKVSGLGRGTIVKPDIRLEVELTDVRRARRLMRQMHRDMRARGRGAIDIETQDRRDAILGFRHKRVDPHNAALTALGLSDGAWGLSIVGNLVRDLGVWTAFWEICTDPAIGIDFHNRLYDEVVLDALGVPIVGPTGDTLLRHHAAFPGTSHKLQPVVCQFIPAPWWKAEYRHGDGAPAELGRYNAQDALFTAMVAPILDAVLVEQGRTHIYEHDNAKAAIAVKMSRHGIPIDRTENRALAAQLLAQIDHAVSSLADPTVDPDLREVWLRELAGQLSYKPRKQDPQSYLARRDKRFTELRDGVRGRKGQILKGKAPVKFSISNNNHIVALLRAQGYRWNKVTTTGAFSGDKEVLEALGHIPEARTVIEYRDAAKLYSTNVKLREEYPIGKESGLVLTADDRLHAQFKVHMITGRWATTPATQNWSKGKAARKDGTGAKPNMRRQVVARPGWKLVGPDCAQLEARVIALLSGDPFLHDLFWAAVGCSKCAEAQQKDPTKFCYEHDIHTVFAVAVWGPDFLKLEPKLFKEARDVIKRGEYGGFYGGDIETLWQSIVKDYPTVTRIQVAKIVETIARKMPGVAHWQALLMAEAQETNAVRTAILGRPREFPLGNYDYNICLNHPVQGTAAEIVDLGLIDMMPRLPPDACPILQVHDQIVVECREADAPAVSKIMSEALTRVVEYEGRKMIFPAASVVGQSWAQL